eukprot:2267785-Pleurochrysis_carterae.AAC.3
MHESQRLGRGSPATRMAIDRSRAFLKTMLADACKSQSVRHCFVVLHAAAFAGLPLFYNNYQAYFPF